MTGEELTEQLTERLGRTDASPFLFVGSGLSRRYLGLEDWEGLLRRFSELTGRPFQYFKSQVTDPHQLPTVASLMAKEFHEIWWNESAYAREREERQDDCVALASPLKFQISKYMSEVSDLDRVPDPLQTEIDLLREAKIDGVITTNWDSLLESLFPDFAVYVGQDEAIFSESFSIAEIFKIHGSHEKPNSLVLTEEDYRDFNSRNVYLAAKLITTFLEHPVVFLGYSLADENIKSILTSILECLDEERARIWSSPKCGVNSSPGC